MDKYAKNDEIKILQERNNELRKELEEIECENLKFKRLNRELKDKNESLEFKILGLSKLNNESDVEKYEDEFLSRLDPNKVYQSSILNSLEEKIKRLEQEKKDLIIDQQQKINKIQEDYIQLLKTPEKRRIENTDHADIRVVYRTPTKNSREDKEDDDLYETDDEEASTIIEEDKEYMPPSYLFNRKLTRQKMRLRSSSARQFIR